MFPRPSFISYNSYKNELLFESVVCTDWCLLVKNVDYETNKEIFTGCSQFCLNWDKTLRNVYIYRISAMEKFRLRRNTLSITLLTNANSSLYGRRLSTLNADSPLQQTSNVGHVFRKFLTPLKFGNIIRDLGRRAGRGKRMKCNTKTETFVYFYLYHKFCWEMSVVSCENQS